MRFSRLPLPRTYLALPALGAAALLAGCGGGGDTGNSAVQVRAINASSNGGTATVSVSGNSVGGGQNYFGVSSYQSAGSGALPVSFSLSSSSSISYPAVTQTFSPGSFYSAIVVGRSDITSSTDPRYPSVIVTTDTFNVPSSNQASLRIIHAAPDAGSVDVLVNGTQAAVGDVYKGVGSYISEPSGSVTIQVNQTGTSTALVPSQTISLTAGHVYTIYVVEPTISATPAYGIQETDDTSAA